MSIFTPRRPRGFHHEYIYYDEREERLRQIEQKAREELGLAAAPPRRHDSLRGSFMQSTSHLRRHKERQSRGGWHLSPLILILGVIILAAVWLMLV